MIQEYLFSDAASGRCVYDTSNRLGVDDVSTTTVHLPAC